MANKQEIQLETLNPEYSRFVTDQVLTDEQLNEIIDFFEDQHRLSRTCLIGTGIVCGLKVTRTGNIVTLSEGVAVTTDGDLLKMGTTEFRYFTGYVPSDNSHYDPFYYKQDSQEKMVTLYQLLTEDDKSQMVVSDVNTIDNLDGTINNWVTILYLDYYIKDPEKCTPTNCDNQGMRQVAEPKVLVLSRDDIDKVIHKDNDEIIGDDIYPKYLDAYKEYFTFPVIHAKRVILNNDNTLNSNILAGTYFNNTKSGNKDLVDAIINLYNAFKFVLDKDGSVNIISLTDDLRNKLTNPTDTFYAQYTYDFYKDVVNAYNDLREVLYDGVSECCPNIYAFPKHIMLGEPNPDYINHTPEFRHRFYPSPVVSKNMIKMQIAIDMFQRLRLMIAGFNPGLVDPIRITPSKDSVRRLEERAIPFYYDNIRLLSKEWDHSKLIKFQEKLNLSYNANQYELPVNDEVLNPLDYDFDPYNFFRIEGHIGKDFKAVLKQLDEIKSAKSLPMDIVAVRLGDVKLSDINLDDFSCQIEDLETMLQAFQVEMNCLLADSSSFFSGFTANPDLPHINLQRYVAAEGLPKWTIQESLLTNVPKPQATESLKAGLRETETVTAKVNLSGSTVGSVKTVTGEALTGLAKVDPILAFCDPSIKPSFTGERIVKTNIETGSDTFGKYYLQALDNEPASVEDFMENARSKASVDTGLNSLKEDDKAVVFEYPMQIIANLNYMQRFIPSYLSDITDKMIVDYRNFTTAFCTRIKVMHTRLERYFKLGDYVSRGYESMYLNNLDNLEKICCGHEKLEVILREIEKRKADILKSLSFGCYAEQHPGLEHKAGVQRGGTFVLVYAGTGKIADLTLSKKELLENAKSGLTSNVLNPDVGTGQYRDSDAFAYYIISNEGNIDKEAELNNFLAYQKIGSGTVFSERIIREVNDKIASIREIFCHELSQPDKDIVIADFCLPYYCCSVCPPVAFIIHKDTKELALPVDRTCNNHDPIPFSFYKPKGAVITSPEAPGSIIMGDNPSFDPGKVPDELLGKAITFTIDGEATTCTIIVTKMIDLSLKFNINDSGDDDFSVDYINNTDETKIGTQVYIWKFSAGPQTSYEGDKSTFTIDKYSKQTLHDQKIDNVEAVVTVKNDPCNSTYKLQIPVPSPIIVDTCLPFVTSFINDKLSVFNSADINRMIKSANNAILLDIYKTAVDLFKSALTLMGTNDPDLKIQIIAKIDDYLRRIYQFDINTSQVILARALEELLRVLMMLMLNLVRCDDKIPVKASESISMDIDVFHKYAPQMKKNYPNLDLKNILETDVKDFYKNFKSRDPHVTGALDVLLADLKEFPEA